MLFSWPKRSRITAADCVKGNKVCVCVLRMQNSWKNIIPHFCNMPVGIIHKSKGKMKPLENQSPSASHYNFQLQVIKTALLYEIVGIFCEW